MDSKKLKNVILKIKWLSFLAMGKTSPNPPVAAVITNSSGDILAFGNTQMVGFSHAEREAYRDLDQKISMGLDSQAESKQGHNLFVSLEPCTHTGKTPPCRDLVIERSPSKVMLGWKDPNPLVLSGDWEAYQKQGIEIRLHPLIAQSSYPFLHGFFQRIKKNRPWVWVKSAITSDGFYATHEPSNQPISSPESQFYLQMLRAKFDAIVVGPKTIQVDEPGLDFRLNEDDFYSKGEVSKIDFGNIAEFFSPGEQMLDSLFAESNAECYSEHVSNLNSYQPWRVFILKEGLEIAPSFVEKQKALNERYGKKLCLFYLLTGPQKNVNPDLTLFSELSTLSDFPILKITDMDSDLFFKDLSNHGVNTVILEAGSFLWNFVKENLDVNDCILTIQSEKEWKEGKSFLGLNQFEKQIQYQVGPDLWQIEMKS